MKCLVRKASQISVATVTEDKTFLSLSNIYTSFPFPLLQTKKKPSTQNNSPQLPPPLSQNMADPFLGLVCNPDTEFATYFLTSLPEASVQAKDNNLDVL